MIHACHALLPGGWARDVRLTISGGRIAAVTPGSPAWPGDERVGVLLPALANLHSHTFQRAMAGLTERRVAGRESFWTWREVMYGFIGQLTPEDVGAVAAMAFAEMAEAGYGSVAEFHYLHHQPGGTAYEDPAELSKRVTSAAEETGIGLTLLPVLYSYGGAGRQPLQGGQLRFGNDVEGFLGLREAAGAHLARLGPDARLGMAPHSLRATCPEDLGRVLEGAGGAAGPVHIHVAEQPKEVADVSAWLGARPVEWLLANAPLGPDWCAIHATHLTAAECAGLARSGTVAGLCPVTEANLGDGPFDGPGWMAAGGAFGVGTDSNVRISVAGELATLEYSQRLRDLSRTVMVAGEGSVGDWLYRGAAAGGARALGRDCGAVEAGRWADLVALDDAHPSLAPLPAERMLDAFVFAAPEGVVSELWSAGRHVVRGGRHVAREAIAARYVAVVRRLAAGL
ncbi:MAG: formimidoylglutamate deiminase [Paracoccaceae bacterium]